VGDRSSGTRWTIFYTAPTAIRACIKWGTQYRGKHDLSSLRLLGSSGKPINPKAWLWYHKVIGGERCPIVDTGGGPRPARSWSPRCPASRRPSRGRRPSRCPASPPAIVDEDGNAMEGEGTGILVLTRPWPGMLRTLYGDDERFLSTYFSSSARATYLVGDAVRRDADGLPVDHRPDRRRHQRLGTAGCRPRRWSRDRVARGRGRGRGRRAGRRGHRAGDRRLRDAPRAIARAATR